MQIDRESKAPEQVTRAQQVRQLLDMVKGKQQKAREPRSTEKVRHRAAPPKRQEAV